MSKYSLERKRVYVAGDRGMVGGALVRRLAREACDILTAPRNLDLRNQSATNAWFEAHRPDAVFLAAARVGGILANSERPGEFLYDNLMLAANVIEAARRGAVGKLMFLGSSCIYPKHAPQPLAENALLTGPLEETNEAYAIAKIAGVKLVDAYRRQYGCDFVSVMPTNLYGPGDTYDVAASHVIPALILKMHEGKQADAECVTLWGSGTPLREFMHVDDLADACVFLMQHYSSDGPINIGSGEEVSIAALARTVSDVVGYDGEIAFDPSKPDGTPRKLMDSSGLGAMGWNARIPLAEGLRDAYAAFLRDRGQSSHSFSTHP